MKKRQIGIVIVCIVLIAVFVVIFACIFTGQQSGTEDSTVPDSTDAYEDLTEMNPDIDLPESAQFSWYKKPYFRATDIHPVKNGLYRWNCWYSFTPTDYGYHPTEYVAYYVGDKCGVANSFGDILCDALYTDPFFCPEPDSIAFADHSLAFNFASGQVVLSGGHGGAIAELHYDINSEQFIYIYSSEGPAEAIEYDKTGVYIAYEAYMEITDRYEDFVAYDIDKTGKIGLYNNGKLVIPFEYVATAEICEDIVAMYDGSMWSYFSVDGDVLMENVTTNSCTFKISENIYSETGEYIDTKIIEMNTVYSYSCGSVPVKKDGKWGYIDKNGEMIIDAVFDKALPAFENRAWVCVDGYWGIIEIL